MVHTPCDLPININKPETKFPCSFFSKGELVLLEIWGITVQYPQTGRKMYN